jgi:hypothetical protein
MVVGSAEPTTLSAISRFVGDLVPVTDRLMALVGATGVGCAHHRDVGQVGILGRYVTLQLLHKRVMRLSRVGQRLGYVCRHAGNYADDCVRK